MSAGIDEQGTNQAPDHKALFKDAMKGDWGKVVEYYKKDCNVRKAKITRTGDTVLHVAVSDGNSGVVADLLAVIKTTEEVKVLCERNEAGNTALHLAAALGMVEICRNLSRKKPEMIIEERNNNGETPLFAAANVGKKDVFFVLQSQIDCLDNRAKRADEIGHCRSNDGNTILHRAIYGEYFELAFEIIHIYPALLNSRNVRGETALHLLAAKPSAFRSGNHIRFLHRLVYECVIIDRLKLRYDKNKYQVSHSAQKEQGTKLDLPQNYGMCLDMFDIFKMVCKVLGSCGKCENDTMQLGQCSKNCTHRTEVYMKPRTGPDGLRSSSTSGSVGSSKTNANEDADKSNGEGSGFPPNYLTCFNFLKTILKFFLIILGIGFTRVEKIKRKKQKLEHANQIMIVLVQNASEWQNQDDGKRPDVKENMLTLDLLDAPPEDNDSSDQKAKDVGPHDTIAKQQKKGPVKETPILLAAKMGIIEIVKKISEDIPIAIQDVDSRKRNIVLLAALHRQPSIYRYMLERGKMRECLFGMADEDGNTALHLAASVFETHPWNIPGSALQMHWEIKWYKYVKNSMELNFFPPFNNNAETARDVFTKDHEKLVNEGAAWLTNTSESCSVVAALIATVAFTSATTIPGGIKSDSGIPALEGQLSFNVFAMSSLVALCFSVTSLVMFLSILTSRYQEMDFENNLPLKLILGLTSLFMSIASTMVAFCGAHFYLIANNLKYAALPIYIVVCVPVTLFVMAQFPLYFDLVKATITHVPERTYKKRSLFENGKDSEEKKQR